MRIFANITRVFNAAHYAVTHLTSIMPAMNECDLTRGLLMYKGLNVDVGSFQVSFGFPFSRQLTVIDMLQRDLRSAKSMIELRTVL